VDIVMGKEKERDIGGILKRVPPVMKQVKEMGRRDIVASLRRVIVIGFPE